MTVSYVRLVPNGYVHIKADAARTVCNKNILQHDYLTITELDPNAHALCHRCGHTRRKGPRTIVAAFAPGKLVEGRHE